jgi:hypothetical protein
VGDEEPITEQAITRHHNDSLGGKAQIDPFGRPDTSWERKSESWLNTTQVDRFVLWRFHGDRNPGTGLGS